MNEWLCGLYAAAWALTTGTALWYYRHLKRAWRQLESNYYLLSWLKEYNADEWQRLRIQKEINETLYVMGEENDTVRRRNPRAD